MFVEQTGQHEHWKVEMGGPVFSTISDILFPGIKDQALDIKLVIESEKYGDDDWLHEDWFEIGGKIDYLGLVNF